MEQKKENRIKCRACGSEESAKWGNRKGKQCYRCKVCSFQFTREDDRKSEKEVMRAVALYCVGLSFRTIGTLLNYHHTTVLRWIMEFARQYYEKPIPKGEIKVELDEMHHFLQSKKTSVGFGKHIVEQLDSLLTGKLAIEIPQRLKNCIID